MRMLHELSKVDMVARKRGALSGRPLQIGDRSQIPTAMLIARRCRRRQRQRRRRRHQTAHPRIHALPRYLPITSIVGRRAGAHDDPLAAFLASVEDGRDAPKFEEAA